LTKHPPWQFRGAGTRASPRPFFGTSYFLTFRFLRKFSRDRLSVGVRLAVSQMGRS
jgi:hypothetical protein